MKARRVLDAIAAIRDSIQVALRSVGYFLGAFALLGCANLSGLTGGDSADARAGESGAAADSGRDIDGTAADAASDAMDRVPTLRQSQTVSMPASTATVKITLAMAGLQTDTLILPIVNYSGNDRVTSVTGGGGTWMRAAGPKISPNATGTAEIWYAPNIVAGARVVTINFAQDLMTESIGSSGIATLIEWTGLLAAPLDEAVENDGAGMTSFSSASLKPSVPNELFIAVSSTQRYGTNLVSGGWNEIDQFSAMSVGYADAVYLVASPPDAEAASGTQGSGTGEAWVTVLATFKP